MWNPLGRILAHRRRCILILDREKQATLIESYAPDHEQSILIRILANQIRQCSLAEFGNLPAETFDRLMRGTDAIGWSVDFEREYNKMLEEAER